VPRKKFDPVDVIEGTGEDIIVWTGPADDAMVVGMRLTEKVGGRNVEISMSPQLKFEDMKKPGRFNKRELAGMKAKANQALAALTNQVNTIKGKDERSEQQRTLINQQIDTLSKGGSQVDAVLEFMEAIKGQVKLQCRVYYAAEEGTQIDLLVTANDAAPAEDAK
jgi:hypothetical protein